MGVPAFFRWLCTRNPKALWEVIENPEEFEQESLNPTIDNLYLDMNGIIHPCSHPEVSGIPVPTTLHDMFVNVFNYVDRLMDLVRPQKILYMAIDGVAPRAKMNQQRARRFRAAQESERAFLEKKRLRDEWAAKGIVNPLVDQYIDGSFDSNQITPGTEFMHHLTIALQYYIYERLNNHPLWQNLTVMFSDASIPGEGEHKILQFIREQRAEINYHPNTRHCIYGADADLIMLALSTHEPWFYIIRETIMQGDDKFCNRCQQRGHFFTECTANNKIVDEVEHPEQQENKKIRSICVNFQMIKIFVVREWLWLEMSDMNKANMKLDLERLVDDFIFLCFLVGNDFLPHIPALRITEGGIDCLILLYKQTVPKAQDYLTKGGVPNLVVLDIFLHMLSVVEEHLLRGQQKKMEIMKQRKDQQSQQGIQQHQYGQQPTENTPVDGESVVESFKRQMKDKLKEVNQAEMSAAQALQATDILPQWQFLSLRQRYYTEKFHIEPKNFIQFRDRLRLNYIEALCWTLKYYYEGCVDWGWYYQFHYAPFAQDISECQNLNITFCPSNQPFLPFQQLLAVLPARSKQFLPDTFHWLMTELQSPIADFYPIDFYVDLKGKKFAWLGEVVLPFVDAPRLVEHHDRAIALTPLSRDERLRNRLGNELLFFNSTRHSEQTIVGLQVADCKRFPTGQPVVSPLPTFPDIPLNHVISQVITSMSTHRKPNFQQHELLPGCEQPSPTMDLQYQQDCEGSKRAFSGEVVRRMLSSLLGIPDTTARPSYNQRQPYKQNYQPRNNVLGRHGPMDLNQLDQLRKQVKQ